MNAYEDQSVVHARAIYPEQSFPGPFSSPLPAGAIRSTSS